MRALSLIVAASLLAGLAALLCPPPLFDFVEYWAAGRLLVSGQDPYDLKAIDRLEREAGRVEDPIPMLNPPWVMPLAIPFGAPPLRVGQALWLALHLAALLL